MSLFSSKKLSLWKELILILFFSSNWKLQELNSPLITIIDGHSSSLSWIGSVSGHKVFPMGVNNFGQSGDLEEIYQYTNIDFKSIIDRIAKSLLNS